jgi:GT2 family glycosyltransferase
MPKPSLAVALLNWNGLELLKRFMPSVTQHSAGATLYVIDNASADASREFLSTHYPQVEQINLPKNLGYAGGYNQGLKQIKEDLVVLLNSDVEVSPNWLAPLWERFSTDAQLGALQPKILDLKNPQKFEYAGAAGGFMDSLGYPFCRGRIFSHLEKDEGQYDTYRQVFWATGACLAVRKTAYQKAGGLNTLLFAHMEEIDLCWRMQIKGYRVAVEPASVVHHLGGGTLQVSPKKTFLNFRNSLIITFLNLPHGEALLKILTRLLLDAVAGIKFLAEGKPKHTWAIVRAHFSFYAKFNVLFGQKINLEQRPLHSLNGVYKSSVVKAFYLKNQKKFSQLHEIR